MFTMLEQALNLDGAGKHLFPVCTLLRVVFPLVDLTVLAATVDRTGRVRGGRCAGARGDRDAASAGEEEGESGARGHGHEPG